MKKHITNSDGSYSLVDLTAEEIAEVQAREAAWMLEKARKDILAQIQDLEAQQTPRRIREATLTSEGKLWLDNAEAQISTLRTQLANL